MNGEMHNTFTRGMLLGAGTMVGVTALAPTTIVQGAVFVGVAFGLLVGPDLDVDAKNISYRIWRKIGLGWFWSAWWTPYRLGFKHRSFWSHMPVVGTIVRLLYMVSPYTILLTRDQPKKRNMFLDYLLAQLISLAFIVGLAFVGTLTGLWVYGLWFVLGLMVADLGHALCDL